MKYLTWLMNLNFSQKTINIIQIHRFSKILAAEISGYLCNTLLRDNDVVSMWHGLEVRLYYWIGSL